MFSVDLSTRECDGYLVVALHGELDLVDAAGVTAALATATARMPTIIVDLAALEFIDAAGAAALARSRAHARRAGGDLLLAAPRRLVGRVFAISGLADDFFLHASVEEAAHASMEEGPGRAGPSPLGDHASEATAGPDALAMDRGAVRNAGLPERSTATGGRRDRWKRRYLVQPQLSPPRP